jgi:hypothetical protein
MRLKSVHSEGSDCLGSRFLDGLATPWERGAPGALATLGGLLAFVVAVATSGWSH